MDKNIKIDKKIIRFSNEGQCVCVLFKKISYEAVKQKKESNILYLSKRLNTKMDDDVL